jgi:hypothetical protein
VFNFAGLKTFAPVNLPFRAALAQAAIATILKLP